MILQDVGGRHLSVDASGLIVLGGAAAGSSNDFGSLQEIASQIVGRGGGDPDVPCDLLLWSRGVGGDPLRTRIGGPAVRKPGVPWPKAQDGSDAIHVAQINFEDSRDIVDCPGALLSIYLIDSWHDYGFEVEDSFFFEWLDVAHVEVQSPAASYCDYPMHANLLRTCDFPVDADMPHALISLGSSKIGGTMIDPQGYFESRLASNLCSLFSFIPHTGAGWPWCNQPAPRSGDFAEFDLAGAAWNIGFVPSNGEGALAVDVRV